MSCFKWISISIALCVANVELCASLDLFALFTAVKHKRLAWLGLHRPTPKIVLCRWPKNNRPHETSGGPENPKKQNHRKQLYKLVAGTSLPPHHSEHSTTSILTQAFPKKTKLKDRITLHVSFFQWSPSRCEIEMGKAGKNGDGASQLGWVKELRVTVLCVCKFVYVPVVPHKVVAEVFKNRKPIAKPLMDWKVLEVSSLSLSFSDYLPTYLSIFYVSIYLSIYQSLSLSSSSNLPIYLSIYLSICLPISIYLSIYLSLSLSLFHLSICLAVYLSICLSICLSVYLSICGAASFSVM